MIPYIVLFWLAGTRAWKEQSLQVSRINIGFILLLLLFVGLRHQVGGDWFTYQATYDAQLGASLSGIFSGSDPGYALMNWLSGQLGWGMHGANLLCALIFTVGLVAFCRAQANPWLAMTVAIPYLVIVVAMGYTRQGVAIGFGMLGLLALERQQFVRFMVLTLLAATFHKTAVVLFAISLMVSTGGWWWRAPLLGAVGFMAYQAILADSVDNYLVNYVQAGYSSQGAAIRVLMNVLPALILLRWHHRLALGEAQRRIWMVMALAALLMVPALMLSNSSTAVDRIALYIIPLQIFVWSRLPAIWPAQATRWSQRVVLYSFMVLMVWLLFAVHAFVWLPYKFYPLVWLFS